MQYGRMRSLQVPGRRCAHFGTDSDGSAVWEWSVGDHGRNLFEHHVLTCSRRVGCRKKLPFNLTTVWSDCEVNRVWATCLLIFINPSVLAKTTGHKILLNEEGTLQIPVLSGTKKCAEFPQCRHISRIPGRGRLDWILFSSTSPRLCFHFTLTLLSSVLSGL